MSERGLINNMGIRNLNHTLYTDLPIDQLDQRLAMEELENRLELGCWIHACYEHCEKEPIPQ